MQDRYVGDIGDFGKYGLLNALAGADLRLGVHWYLNADEEANGDGRFTDYLRIRGCDPQLYDALNDIVRRGRRRVAEVESAGILPSRTLYFSQPLRVRDARNREERLSRRADWNAKALETLAAAEMAFMDRDGGFPWLTASPARAALSPNAGWLA